LYEDKNCFIKFSYLLGLIPSKSTWCWFSIWCKQLFI